MKFGAKPVTQFVNDVRRSPPLTWLSNAATVSDRDSVCDKHVVSGADVLMVWVLREGSEWATLAEGLQ